MVDVYDKISLLRAELLKQSLYGFVIPMNDEFQCEYVPDAAKRLAFMTEFSGSAGTVIILQDKAAFFTDGRYTLQAKDQVNTTIYSIFDSGDISPQNWVAEHMKAGEALGFDPWLHTLHNAESFAAACAAVGGVWQPCDTNPVDSIWSDRPLPPRGKLITHELRFSGETSASKRSRIAAELQKSRMDAMLITLPDSICWLLNIRGSDVHCTPFALCYAFLHSDSRIDLFVDAEKLSKEVEDFLGDSVTLLSPDRLSSYINALNSKKIQCDPFSSSLWFFTRLAQAGALVIQGKDLCQYPKACKNITEQQGAKTAHIRDGIAVVKFLCWLDNQLGKEIITEISAAEKLLSFRQEQEGFVYPSFDTIAGFGSNGAIIHYHASTKTNKALENNGLLLLDSGGQYHEGTTDITRTIAIRTPTNEQITRFTQVLKGHIALALAKFPEGTTGSQLDILARYALWQDGCDYGHGTGHGVGSFLSVHEGPQRISKAPSTVALQPGMIVSNEPGYYKAGEYGIRIESLVLVNKCPEPPHEGKTFLHFTTLTCVPIDKKLIDKNLLTLAEINWINDYHQQVQYNLLPYCDNQELKEWLKNSTLPI